MKVYTGYRKRPRIEMLPLIDIVFLLLVFFIYAMLSMAVHHSLPVNLPQSTTARLEKRELLSITLKADGSLFVNKRPVSLASLAQELEEYKKQRGLKGVLLFADRSVTYQMLFRVLDRIREAGLSSISLQAEVREPR